MRRLMASLFLVLMAILMLLPASALAAPANKVYVIRMDNWQEIDPGLAQITRRIMEMANTDPQAAAVVVVLDTPGGWVHSAVAIKDLLLQTKLRTIAYVQGDAFSAGALIATAAEKLYLHPGSALGAAEPRNASTNQPVDHKVLSSVAGSYEATAIARGRDPQIARAMVDRSTPAPGQRGELLTLNFKDAIATRYADGEAASIDEAIQQAGLTNYELFEPPVTFSERAGRFLTTPFVATMLLVVGVIAIGIEFIKPGVTLPGLIGIVSLGLFFLGNTLVGTANWLEISLAVIGILLLIVEAFVPGFGVFGVGGVVSMGASIFLSVPSPELAWQYLMWTAIAFLGVLVGLVRAISKRGLGKALTLSDSAKGWTAPRTDDSALIGREGVSLTVLRPAGTAEFGEQKVDVVTEGEFISVGQRVRVVRVEGTRVVVRTVDEG